MAENIIDNSQSTAPVIDPAQAELASQMASAFSMKVPDTEIANTAPSGTEDKKQDTQPAPFSFDTLKEKFGYQAPEEVLTEIEQLRALKANPPSQVLEFENEESKNILLALQKGDTKPLVSYLNQKQKLEDTLSLEINKDSASDIVKYGMSLKYKDLSAAEIDYKYKKQFGAPLKPAQGTDDDEEYKAKLDQWQEVVNDRNMELMIEAKMLRPELEASKTKLVFPEIDQQTDDGYLDYKKAIEEEKKLSAEAVKAYEKFTPEMVETKLDFNDKANGVEFPFLYKPSPESFEKTRKMVNNIDEFYAMFQTQDGSPDRIKFFKFINSALNMDSMLLEAMNQSKNATLKSMLADNSQGGMVRQLNTGAQEENELDQAMSAFGIHKRK